MSTQSQTKYIIDLAVVKTKEFKEVKELLIANQIVGDDSTIVTTAGTLAEICNALTDLQASRLIDILTAAEQPARAPTYGAGRVRRTIAALDDIKKDIANWGF